MAVSSGFCNVLYQGWAQTTAFPQQHYFDINPNIDSANLWKQSDFEPKQFKAAQEIRNVIKGEAAEIS